MKGDRTCVVVMPFGTKMVDGRETDFDDIFENVICKAIEAVDLKDGSKLVALRCDKFEKPGDIHEDMFSHLATADVAVVDLTSLNANVFYELGARHALRESVTVLIRQGGGPPPFNIQSLRCIEYTDAAAGGLPESIRRITEFIEQGLTKGHNDSPIQPVLDRVRAQTRRIETQESFVYRLVARPDTTIEIRTGDIAKWTKGADVWVNSENTNLQMARFYERSLSATIRYRGAKKNEDGEIVEDTIANELVAKLKGRDAVALGTVFDTSSGDLLKTHGVKRIFHVALVRGVPGDGYRVEREMVDVCVERCLRRMDSEPDELRSIAFPMMGTGAGGGGVDEVAKILTDTIVRYLTNEPASTIATVFVMAWSPRDLSACRRALGNHPALTRDPFTAGS
jgi:O-acetyl-ADP-ribose deacetylase (regulator of RNase III)